ncbi:MAG: hypothetical protein ACPLRM_04035, partial [Anaerolineae bacterium]
MAQVTEQTWREYERKVRAVEARRKRIIAITLLRTLVVLSAVTKGSIGIQGFYLFTRDIAQHLWIWSWYGIITPAAPLTAVLMELGARVAFSRALATGGLVGRSVALANRVIATAPQQQTYEVLALLSVLAGLAVAYVDFAEWWPAPLSDKLGLNIGSALGKFEQERAEYEKKQEALARQAEESKKAQTAKVSRELEEKRSVDVGIPGVREQTTEKDGRLVKTITYPQGFEVVIPLVREPHAFNHLVGMDEAIEAVRDTLELHLKRPDLVEKYKLRPAKGVILYGPS